MLLLVSYVENEFWFFFASFASWWSTRIATSRNPKMVMDRVWSKDTHQMILTVLFSFAARIWIITTGLHNEATCLHSQENVRCSSQKLLPPSASFARSHFFYIINGREGALHKSSVSRISTFPFTVKIHA
jgi:hypothetical protein